MGENRKYETDLYTVRGWDIILNRSTAPVPTRSLEIALTRLRGIRKARVDVAPDGGFLIEVLAVPERSERSLHAEVAATARGVLGTGAPVDTIKIQLAGRAPARGAEQPRRKLSSLITRRTQDRFSTQVLLSRGDDVATGESECYPHRNQARAVAQAIIDGLSEVSELPLQLQAVESVLMGEQTLALVSLRSGDRLLVGSAEVHFDLPDAIARATLHALNRSLSRSAH